ncbi:flagellar basal body L-ring protein FlgH [Xanthomonas arboricola pv. juglandis]|uniref:Flagellar basal body L-ring protein FlgH n=1 Tax=Xanthomonas campestris pv. juglandis TaxID=195709 RepID=A0A7U7D5N2_XANCJ|nr:flagellar basal body L-ring protein FlgH [Xanthomonas arboricola]AKU51578.1 flagellar biosynthesis protein FlgH [Xanthomonas arboricola pv. juglandis]KOB02977.1 flagellar L-ring protein FlgH [Xanthomonas arboricola]KOB03313.1 flagellar L-ring protein FlgH [Xanthomonas arboricola]KOB10308.1 flagellar L-ring protein FlgH [Xanthomonas arboricola]KOB11272.1 flagellar L-ring protein FlgH [Xanthomonas arboricola]
MLAALLSATASQCAFAQESLINSNTYRGIAADRRAYRVGDVLTVNVLEAARARSGAATDAGSDVRLSGTAGNNAYRGSFDAGLSAAAKGSAETSRVGELRTQLSVQVKDVLSDGSLVVEGEQSLLINKEDQRITLSGIVRPDDILADNTVWSHRLANARVEFNGKGVVAESQRQSVAYRLLKWLRVL